MINHRQNRKEIRVPRHRVLGLNLHLFFFAGQNEAGRWKRKNNKTVGTVTLPEINIAPASKLSPKKN